MSASLRLHEGFADKSVCHPLERKGWQTDEGTRLGGQGYSLIAAH